MSTPVAPHPMPLASSCEMQTICEGQPVGSRLSSVLGVPRQLFGLEAALSLVLFAF